MNIEHSLTLPRPYDAPGVFAFLSARAVPGVEIARRGENGQLYYARTVKLSGGPGAFALDALPSADGWKMRITLELSDDADEPEAMAAIHRLLDLHSNTTQIDAQLASDPLLAPSVRATPGIRIPGAVDPQEIIIRAIIGQQISVKAATGHLARLSAAVGSPYSSQFSGLTLLFPTPEQIAQGITLPEADQELDPQRILRLPRRSMAAVANTAHALATDQLEVSLDAAPDQLREQLVAMPGIGPWTAAYISMRVLGAGDAWLPKDVALIAGALKLGLLSPQLTKNEQHRALADYAQRFSPWRSYAVMHLWQAAAG